MDGKVQRNSQFSFCRQEKLFVAKSSFEEFNDVFFTVVKCEICVPLYKQREISKLMKNG